jgi:hypothetical protein
MNYTTLQMLRANPEAFKGWAGQVLTTNRWEVAELDKLCGEHDIRSKLMVHFDKDTMFEYKRRYM